MKTFKQRIEENTMPDPHYAEAEEHLSKANDAEAKGDMKAFHAHMADHHDAMSEWHDSKGRSASADKHAEKAEYHHEKSLTVHEEAEQIDELSSELLQRYKDKARASADELTAQGKHKKSLDRIMAHMKATGKQIEKTTSNIRKSLNKEETVVEGSIGKMLKKHPKIKAIHAARKEKIKAFKEFVKNNKE